MSRSSAGGRHARPRRSIGTLTLAVVTLTIVVISLGALVLFIQLKPAPTPRTTNQRDLQSNLRAVDEDPDDPWAWASVGLAYLDAGDQEKARSAFETSLEKDPGIWISNFQLGLLLRESDPAKAEDLIRKGGEAAPHTYRVAPFTALGDLLYEQGSYKAAKKAYLLALADSPIVIEAQAGLARTLLELGDGEGALEHFKEALRMDPGNDEIKQQIAELEATEKKSKEKS